MDGDTLHHSLDIHIYFKEVPKGQYRIKLRFRISTYNRFKDLDSERLCFKALKKLNQLILPDYPFRPHGPYRDRVASSCVAQ
jgi:hypothetical protein